MANVKYIYVACPLSCLPEIFRLNFLSLSCPFQCELLERSVYLTGFFCPFLFRVVGDIFIDSARTNIRCANETTASLFRCPHKYHAPFHSSILFRGLSICLYFPFCFLSSILPFHPLLAFLAPVSYTLNTGCCRSRVS